MDLGFLCMMWVPSFLNTLQNQAIAANNMAIAYAHRTEAELYSRERLLEESRPVYNEEIPDKLISLIDKIEKDLQPGYDYSEIVQKMWEAFDAHSDKFSPYDCRRVSERIDNFDKNFHKLFVEFIESSDKDIDPTLSDRGGQLLGSETCHATNAPND